MSIEQVSAAVVEVLTRAQSLFTEPADPAAQCAAGSSGAAAQASRTITTRTSDLSGAVVQAHGELVANASRRLETSAAADAQLAEHLGRAADTHSGGLARASELRAAAGDVPSQLAPFAGLPAGELAALKVLRARVADMAQLTTEHNEQGAQLARQIQALGFGS